LSRERRRNKITGIKQTIVYLRQPFSNLGGGGFFEKNILMP